MKKYFKVRKVLIILIFNININIGFDSHVRQQMFIFVWRATGALLLMWMLPSNQTWHVTVHTFLVLCQISSFYSFSFSSKLDCILLLTEIQPKRGKHFALNNHNCHAKLLVRKNFVWVKWSGEGRRCRSYFTEHKTIISHDIQFMIFYGGNHNFTVHNKILGKWSLSRSHWVYRTSKGKTV